MLRYSIGAFFSVFQNLWIYYYNFRLSWFLWKVRLVYSLHSTNWKAFDYLKKANVFLCTGSLTQINSWWFLCKILTSQFLSAGTNLREHKLFSRIKGNNYVLWSQGDLRPPMRPRTCGNVGRSHCRGCRSGQGFPASEQLVIWS